MPNDNERPVAFSVTYDGEALEQHTMDVRDLAPALLSLGQAFERANSLLNGDSATVSLQIKAQTAGSFDIAFLLSQTLLTASEPLGTGWLQDANAISGLLIGTPVAALNLVALIKRLRGKTPKQTESQQGYVIFEVDDVRLSVPVNLARLYNDKMTRSQLEVVVRPLQKPGIHKVVFSQGKKELASVDNTEVEYFTLSDDQETTKEYIIPRQQLQIAGLRFKKGKWQLSDGAHENWYSMDDKDFQSEIDNGKTFGKYHILICDVLMTQRLQNDGKLKLDYAVKKVIKHIVRPEQSSYLPKE